MPSGFSGEYEQKVDGKGRMSIPADFRAVLDAQDKDRAPGAPTRMVLQFSLDLKGHMRVYTMDRIERIRRRIDKAPEGRNKKGLQHFYNASTAVIDVDKDGRTVLPVKYRNKIDLVEGEVTFLGYGPYFEIWKKETYAQTKEPEIAEWFETVEEGVDPLSLIPELDEDD